MQTLEAVYITNGRATGPFALHSLKDQSVSLRIYTVKNKAWVTAVNQGLHAMNKAYMLRLDDDMFLHPKAVEFMMATYKGTISHAGKLYEGFTKRLAGAVKIYNVEKVKAIGGFRPNQLGKIDRTFEEDAKAAGHKMTCADKKSPVGIHACSTWAQQIHYESLWGYKKSTRDKMKKYKRSITEQYEMRTWKIERINRQNNTKFWRWLNEHN